MNIIQQRKSKELQVIFGWAFMLVTYPLQLPLRKVHIYDHIRFIEFCKSVGSLWNVWGFHKNVIRKP